MVYFCRKVKLWGPKLGKEGIAFREEFISGWEFNKDPEIGRCIHIFHPDLNLQREVKYNVRSNETHTPTKLTNSLIIFLSCWREKYIDLCGCKEPLGASLVAQWLRICLPMQGTRVRALVWEDPTCRGGTGPVSHNYWACASGACAPQQERPR